MIGQITIYNVKQVTIKHKNKDINWITGIFGTTTISVWWGQTCTKLYLSYLTGTACIVRR